MTDSGTCQNTDKGKIVLTRRRADRIDVVVARKVDATPVGTRHPVAAREHSSGGDRILWMIEAGV